MFKQLKKNGLAFNLVTNIIFILASITIIAPILLCISVSLSEYDAIYKFGYTIFPKRISLEAYKYVLGNIAQIIQAYKVSIIVMVLGTTLTLVVTSMYAYVTSRRDFGGRVFFNYFGFLPMLFSGGLVSTYLWYVSIGMFDNIWVLFLPFAFNSWYCIILRAFFQTGVPSSIVESAKLDGASEMRIFFAIVWPISLPSLASIALISALGLWNDWNTPLIYIRNEQLYGIQFYLQRVMTNLQMAIDNSTVTSYTDVPTESVRMVMCIAGMGPLLFLYPLVQRFFVKGLTIGAVKG